LGSFYCTTAPQLVDHATFEKVCEETLESLTEYFEQIVEEADNLKSGDVSYSSGVLTVNLGPQFGTYVINRQSPNRQIWLSSPFSGPKRYDFITEENCWVYKHDGKSLHGLLQNEMSKIVSLEVNFANCMYGKL
ncbi:frataxin -like, mitochondrial, partial [Asbolus verrucosus]